MIHNHQRIVNAIKNQPNEINLDPELKILSQFYSVGRNPNFKDKLRLEKFELE